jgi:hypothetical protein
MRKLPFNKIMGLRRDKKLPDRLKWEAEESTLYFVPFLHRKIFIKGFLDFCNIPLMASPDYTTPLLLHHLTPGCKCGYHRVCLEGLFKYSEIIN